MTTRRSTVNALNTVWRIAISEARGCFFACEGAKVPSIEPARRLVRLGGTQEASSYLVHNRTGRSGGA